MKFYRIIQDLIYPNKCLVCNKLSEGVAECVCKVCITALEFIGSSNRLGRIQYCTGIEEVYSIWIYDKGLKEIINALKYEDHARVGADLARFAAILLPRNIASEIDLITPVPLHSSKKRERGYNQSHWIAKTLADEWQIDYSQKVLVKVKSTQSQTRMNLDERKNNIENSIKWKKPLNGLIVGIVDDIITTGATVSECGQQLKLAGAKKVIAISCGSPRNFTLNQ
jgi:ComF family protein